MDVPFLEQPRLSFTLLRKVRVPVVLQSEATECGLACLAMVAAFHGYTCSLAELRQRWSLSLKGSSLSDLIEMGDDLALTSRALKLELEHLRNLRCPAVLHWNMNHFVVLERADGRRVQLVDPAIGRLELTYGDVSKHFTGVALELHPSIAFRRRTHRSCLPLSTFFRKVEGLPSALLKLLLLSLALQAFVLVAPFFGQIVIDDVVVSNDRSLLTVLGVAFLLVGLIQVCVSAIRGWLVIFLGTNLQLGWVTRLFHHLIRLPFEFFERRHLGDIVSRFESIRAVEALVAHSMVEAAVDGFMALTTLSVMAFYSPMLAGVVTGSVLVYGLLRLSVFHGLWNATNQSLVLGARANSLFMETIRAILPIKNFGREAIRGSSWQAAKVSALNAEIRARRIQLFQDLAHTGVFLVENIGVLWLGALAILERRLTIGMLMAFISYKNHFASRTAALIDKAVEFRLVYLHLERLADIALTRPDPATQAARESLRRRPGVIEAKELWFRYSSREPFVIQATNLRVEAGECVAITGPSGIGKTTLLKILMGLLEPTSGRILVDGTNLGAGVLAEFRRQSGAVMQDDVLLSGSLAENIAFFDSNIDAALLEDCARCAAIHDDILRMPMGYSTLVGDMGSSLSGGQRQRVLLARALYRRPQLLFLDEATSHLDPFTEHRIHHVLRRMKITRVIIAHRRETLAVADHIVRMNVIEGQAGPHPRTVQ